MTAVKICGLTHVKDALWAWRCGADLLGFVLVPHSPRYVSPEDVAHLSHALRREGCTAPLVGVLASTSPPECREAAATYLDIIQWHGAEGECPPFEALGRPVIAAQRVRPEPSWHPLPMPEAWAILLDAFDPVRLGGTGTPWDWRLLKGRPPIHERLILAGGLTPENVAKAIAIVHPWGVDVSSGVEAAPGRKDARRVQEFIRNVKGASYGE
ncbi:MAG: phosphoribosylanthranilate isomerase [Chloroflexi bacterium]|nr:phosphoribosylanthranilate isomerase [Chloroflexota bacterium]